MQLGFIESEEARIIETVEQEVIEENLNGANELEHMRVDAAKVVAATHGKEKEKESGKELELGFKQKSANRNTIRAGESS